MGIFYNIHDVNVPVLDDNQYYIYVLENYPQGNIKIGRSSNMKQRLQSLSGSNSGGNKIIKCFVSEPTYLYTLENIAHWHFNGCRIKGTEWFDGSKLTFEDVVEYIDNLFQKDEYVKCNNVRENFVKIHSELNAVAI